MHPYITLSLAAALVTACDVSTAPHLAAIGPTSGVSSSTAALVISPNRVQMSIGGTTQLSTNAPADRVPPLQWLSSTPAIASVTQSGLVTAFGAGTAIITVRYVSDTTNQASAVIEVASPGVRP